MDLTPKDKDLIVRTIIGEAGNQPDEGQAAVAHVILNRLNSGKYGNNAAGVVLAPRQFETWDVRPQELATIPRTSKIYQKVGAIVDGAANGEIEDPTGGATHFLQEETVRDRRGGSLPNWAQGKGLKIGAHTFFNPGGALAMNQEKAPEDFLGAFIKSSSAPAVKSASDPKSDVPDYLGTFLKAKEGEAPAVVAPPAVQTLSPPPVPPAGGLPAPASVTPPGDQGPSEFQERTLKPLKNALLNGPQTVATDYLGRLKELADQNAGIVGEGIKDWTTGNTATGAGKAGLGALGYLMSPIGAIDKPIEKMTGNKGFAEKAAMVVPGTGAGKVANAARPTVKALSDLVKDVGADNLPAIIKRMEANPNLTLMDVAPAVRGNAAGLATDPRNVPAMTHLNEFQKTRMAGRPNAALNAFEDVLGPTPNVKQTVDDLKAAAQKTGKELIEPAIASAKPVDVTGVVQNIDKQFPAAMLRQLKEGNYKGPDLTTKEKELWSLRERLRGDWKDRDQMFLDADKAHDLQKELRLGSSDPQFGYQGRQVRRELVDAIDQAADKKYKPALKQYADDKSVEEYFKHGFDLFSNPTSAEKSLANHPDMWKAKAEDASKVEIEAAKKGAMLGAHTRIANMRKGIDIPEGSFAHQRLAALVGDKEASKIVNILNDWRSIAETDNLLTKNSATALRQAGQKNREVREGKTGQDILQSMMPAAVFSTATHLMSGGNPILSALVGGTTIAGGKLANVAGKAHDVASNRAYAQWASAMGPKKDDLLEILREAARRSDPSSKSQKLIDLVPSPLLQALPR